MIIARNRFKSLTILIFLMVAAMQLTAAAQQPTDTGIYVPLGGNTWQKGDTTGGRLTNNGIEKWTSVKTSFVTCVRFTQPGSFMLILKGTIPGGVSSIKVLMGGKSKLITLKAAKSQLHFAGIWQLTDTGYKAIILQGISKNGVAFANIEGLQLRGSAVSAKTAFVKNNEGDFFYWGRRGPSVHLSYTVPKNTDAEWFYNEVTVTPGNDVIGSYFMADGFGEGYFGMQVNSATERRILFSVWSPFNTGDPKSIPDSAKIKMLRKGSGVHTGEFGNEGSGGQSYLQYNWKAGNTYKFLIHAKPTGQNSTDYTAYFYAPEQGRWMLIASFNRPKTNTYLKHLHSFLENFEPEQGYITRKVLFGNEWVLTSAGQWVKLTEARFTVDNTGAKGYRMDYSGGSEDNHFFLKNCGFFDHYTTRNTVFTRSQAAPAPEIDVNKLP